jgi:hypothetical protein
MSPTIMYVVLHVLGLGLSIATLALTVVPGVHICMFSSVTLVYSALTISELLNLPNCHLQCLNSILCHSVSLSLCKL